MTATSAPLMKASASAMLFNRTGFSVVLAVPAEQRSGLGRVYMQSSSKRMPPTHTQASQPHPHTSPASPTQCLCSIPWIRRTPCSRPSLSPRQEESSLTVGCRVITSSTPRWDASGKQDNKEAREDRCAHGTSLPSPRHATLLRSSPRQETRQLLWGPTTSPGAVGREQLAQGKAFSSRDNCLAGESPSLPCRNQPWRAAPTLPLGCPHPQHWTSQLPCTFVTRRPS